MCSSPREPVRQAAAIALHGDHVCLVLSSNGRRWVLPKGTVETGETASQAAVREAWEEAGLSGELSREPIGKYIYEKNGLVYRVTLFLMVVRTVAFHWPEAHRRTRRWVATSWAHHCVHEPELRRLLRDAVARCIGEVAAVSAAPIVAPASEEAAPAA